MATKDDKQLPAIAVTEGLQTQPYTPAAGGMGALTSVLKEAHRHSGLVKGARLLAYINQADGFDCPGCAWPDPPAGERSAFEFCENGAKAAGGAGKQQDPALAGREFEFVAYPRTEACADMYQGSLLACGSAPGQGNNCRQRFDRGDDGANLAALVVEGVDHRIGAGSLGLGREAVGEVAAEQAADGR